MIQYTVASETHEGFFFFSNCSTVPKTELTVSSAYVKALSLKLNMTKPNQY